MAKITKVLCDVKLCARKAEREFEVNGETLYVCGEQCFARFWCREYGTWKDSPYRTQVVFQYPVPMKEYRTHEISKRKQSVEIFRSDLQIVKPITRIMES